MFRLKTLSINEFLCNSGKESDEPHYLDDAVSHPAGVITFAKQLPYNIGQISCSNCTLLRFKKLNFFFIKMKMDV